MNAAKAALIAWIGYDLVRLVQFIVAGFGQATEFILIAALAIMLVNVFRRPPIIASRLDAGSFVACGISLGALTLALLLVQVPNRPTIVSETIATAGALLLLPSVIALGTSFSVLPAAIRVRTGGPFGVIRHPIYTSYVLIDLGIVLSQPHWLIAAAAAAEVAALVWRARIEERLLGETLPDYEGYRRRVRTRFLPGLY
jgi:protein-S-isoprenylcysteine O-methyltransferase Ste14